MTIGYPVSAKKFWLLSIASVGWWTVYWIYMNFKTLERRELRSIHYSAESYTVAIVLSYYNLLEFIELAAKDRGITLLLPKKRLELLAFFIFFPAFFHFFSDDLWYLQGIFQLSFLLVLFQANRALNRLNRMIDVKFAANLTFDYWEKVILFVGAIYWVLALYVGALQVAGF